MNRNEARDILPLYADGELDPGRATELEECLTESAELRRELERWRAVRRSTNRVVTGVTLPRGFEQRIRAELNRASAGSSSRRLRWASGITAIAAAIVFMVVAWWQAESPPPGPRLLDGASFADVYRNCAVQQRHRGVAVDLADVRAAHDQLTGSEAHEVLVPDLARLGFELDGVCRCLHVKGVRVVHVFYRRSDPDPAVVSFFTVDQKVRLKNCGCKKRCKGGDGVLREYEMVDCDGVRVWKWDDPERSFTVCSKMEPARLRELVDTMHVASVQAVPVALAWAD
jgi:anti-sigma factor RsiW